MRIIVTGGAGFIGSALVRRLIKDGASDVLTFDALTYAGNLETLASVSSSPRHQFVKGDVRHQSDVSAVLNQFKPDLIFHLAAETHVDRSIDNPHAFIETNIVGTYSLLEAVRTYWSGRAVSDRQCFRVVQVSTDEVFGALGPSGQFSETSPYAPNSPYAASKAASDHLVSAWHHTYGLPLLTSNCSNNYGPYQYAEKLIPVILKNALAGRPLPIYGTGHQVRDWLHVDDHVDGLLAVAARGQPGRSYNIGGHQELTNLELVRRLCGLLDDIKPSPAGPYHRLISHVEDRPGHDARYALNTDRASRELEWMPTISFEQGLRNTVEWYLAHPEWLEKSYLRKAHDDVAPPAQAACEVSS